MCTMIVEKSNISGMGKGAEGWFNVNAVNVSFDHPLHSPEDHTLNIDFVNNNMGPGARVAVELSPDSAGGLIRAITQALKRGGNQSISRGQISSDFPQIQ